MPRFLGIEAKKDRSTRIISAERPGISTPAPQRGRRSSHRFAGFGLLVRVLLEACPAQVFGALLEVVEPRLRARLAGVTVFAFLRHPLARRASGVGGDGLGDRAGIGSLRRLLGGVRFAAVGDAYPEDQNGPQLRKRNESAGHGVILHGSRPVDPDPRAGPARTTLPLLSRRRRRFGGGGLPQGRRPEAGRGEAGQTLRRDREIGAEVDQAEPRRGVTRETQGGEDLNDARSRSGVRLDGRRVARCVADGCVDRRVGRRAEPPAGAEGSKPGVGA